MLIKNKWVAILLLIVGVVIAASNVYLFLNNPGVWYAVNILVGIGWIWIGATNLRRLQKEEPK